MFLTLLDRLRKGKKKGKKKKNGKYEVTYLKPGTVMDSRGSIMKRMSTDIHTAVAIIQVVLRAIFYPKPMDSTYKKLINRSLNVLLQVFLLIRLSLNHLSYWLSFP